MKSALPVFECVLSLPCQSHFAFQVTLLIKGQLGASPDDSLVVLRRRSLRQFRLSRGSLALPFYSCPRPFEYSKRAVTCAWIEKNFLIAEVHNRDFSIELISAGHIGVKKCFFACPHAHDKSRQAGRADHSHE